MRTPIIRALGALALALTVIACSGSPASPAPATPAPVADTTATPVPTATTTTTAPSQEVGRVGILAPGSYRFSQHDPAVTFTVPKDWAMTEAMPRHFGLRPTTFTADNSVRIWYDMRAASRDPSCPEAPDPAIGHTADLLTAALRRRPGVGHTQADPITVGGLDGYRFDVWLDESWTASCPFLDGTPGATLFTDDLDPDDPAFWGLGGYDERMRIIALDDGAGSNVLITIDAVDPATFEDLVAASTPVIETFAFSR